VSISLSSQYMFEITSVHWSTAERKIILNYSLKKGSTTLYMKVRTIEKYCFQENGQRS
jgi:hypothetical protein